ncbi:tripartite tricarboxylate transporter substrate binding protein [Bordetella genomosp. 13]|uniref:tripartite tricarboxylate transporter substrate binding protein n=1 Tax=Bordetella genomosp. 13 TaxID=463040 RepID=UPI001643321E|nr:tripartite tricarboxylate transporter substrate binding protein [Bordetella genomosp. 13]
MRKLIHTLAVLAGLALPLAASAAPFPAQPVTIVVPFAPGGPSDNVARVLARELSKRWGQSVIVDNRPGGQTTIATSFVARAKADGHTLLYISPSWTTNPLLMDSLPYKPQDLTPVTLVGRYPLALLTRGGSGPRSLAEFIEQARASSQPVALGNAGIGSSSHLAALEFADAVGIKIISVPYKAGTIGAINDLIGGQISGVFEGRNFKPFVDDGRLRALLIGSAARMENWQDVPSATDVGYPDLELSSYFGIMVGARTPPEVRDQLARDIGEILRKPEVRAHILDLGLTPEPQTPQAFGDFLQAQHDRMQALIGRHKGGMQ